MNIDILISKFGRDRIEKNKELFSYLSLHTHTKAEYFFDAKTQEDLINIISLCKKHNDPFLVIGGGSNVVMTKSEIPGLVIKNNYRAFTLEKDNVESVELLISSGFIVSIAVQKTIEQGWEGLEYQEGLPGTMGGAIYMNSKWMKPPSFVGDCLIQATLIDQKGNIKKVNRDYFRFGYDYSILQDTKEIFIEGIFKLKKTSSEILKKRAKESSLYRRQTQPVGAATAGCFFRNIPDNLVKRLHLPTSSSGYLIDKAGLKNLRFGSFIVSDKHANFIINTDNQEVKPEDLLQLIRSIKV